MSPKEKLAQAMADLGLTVESVFVPWSKSRSAPKDGIMHISKRNLNWRVTVKCKGREIITTDYSAGIAHAPSYQSRITLEVQQRLEFETEHGKNAHQYGALGIWVGRKPILPDPQDVVYSLVSDGDAVAYPSFEDWASSLGYDTDSRAAEATYRACLDIGLRLRSALSIVGYQALFDACQGY